MSKGRKAHPDTEVVDIPGAVAVVAAENSAAANALVAMDVAARDRTTALAAQLAYDGPLEPDMLEFTVATHMRRTVEAALDAGRALLLLKERVPHGEFEHRLDRLGVAPRAARKLMQACLKFANRPSTAVLTHAAGNATKLLELLVLDDDEVQQLADEGSVLGIDLDDIASMSARELRDKLREAREDLAAKDDLIVAKNAKIDALVAKKRWKPGPEDIARTEREKAALDQWTLVLAGLDAQYAEIEALVRDIYEADPTPALQLRMRQGLEYAAGRLAATVDSLGLQVDLSALSGEAPAWLAQAVGADRG